VRCAQLGHLGGEPVSALIGHRRSPGRHPQRRAGDTGGGGPRIVVRGKDVDDQVEEGPRRRRASCVVGEYPAEHGVVGECGGERRGDRRGVGGAGLADIGGGVPHPRTPRDAGPGSVRVNTSGGKSRTGRTRHGSIALRTALTEAAHAAARTKNTYLAAHHAHIRGRRGLPKAFGATRHDLLIAYWHVVHDQVDYVDLGPDWAQRRRSTEHRTRRLVHQLEQLGHAVTLGPGR
jgi:hypothetical protein